MYLSVIIPTNKNIKDVKNVLLSLKKQILSEDCYELILVGNGVKRINKSDLIQYQKEIRNLSYHYDRVPGLLAGRHRGVKEAKGDILVFADDDIIADQKWLKSIHETFKDPAVKLVGGKSLPYYEINPPGWVRALWSYYPDGMNNCGYLSLMDFGNECREINPALIWGLNFSIRKDILIKLGGFHPDGYPWELRRFRGDGEIILGKKALEKGMKSIYQPDALVYHCIPRERLTIEYFKKRSFLQGISDSYTELRDKMNIDELDQGNKKNKKEVNYLKVRANIKNILKLIFGPKDSHQFKQIIEDIRKEYSHGFKFHRNEFDNDKNLRKWVLKKNYWDYRI